MPATLEAQPLSAGPIRPLVTVYGETDEAETAPRVAVQLTIHLTFAEILGRLLLSPSGALWSEDLENGDESAIRCALWFALADTSLSQGEDFAAMAMDIYTGRRPSNLHGYAVQLGTVITHMFGVTAPEQPGPAVECPKVYPAAVGLAANAV